MKSEKEARQRRDSRIEREQEEHTARERRLRKDDEAARLQAQNRNVDAMESMRQVCFANGIPSLVISFILLLFSALRLDQPMLPPSPVRFSDFDC